MANRLMSILGWAWRPIGGNFVFFVCLLLAGYILLLSGALSPYVNHLSELFTAVYVACILLCIFPKGVRSWVGLILALVLYGGAFALFRQPLVLVVGAAHLLWLIAIAVVKYRMRFNVKLAEPVNRVVEAILGIGTIAALGYAFPQNNANLQSLKKNIETQVALRQEQKKQQALEEKKAAKTEEPAAAKEEEGTQPAPGAEPAMTVSNALPIDSCTFRSPELVVIIDKSGALHRSGLYGYSQPLASRLTRRAQDSTLVVYIRAAIDQYSDILGSETDVLPATFRQAGYSLHFLSGTTTQDTANGGGNNLTVIHLDNAYTTASESDSICDRIISRYESRNAIVLYQSTYRQGSVPFWIWASRTYRDNHPYGVRAIQRYARRPTNIDDLTHTLLFLGGIHTPYYNKEKDVFNASL